jgi:hypothetical protein
MTVPSSFVVICPKSKCQRHDRVLFTATGLLLVTAALRCGFPAPQPPLESTLAEAQHGDKSRHGLQGIWVGVTDHRHLCPIMSNRN